MTQNKKCPFGRDSFDLPNLKPHTSFEAYEQKHQEIKNIVSSFKKGAQIVLDTPEKVQAYYAYMLFLVGENMRDIMPAMHAFVDSFEDEKINYHDICDEMRAFFVKHIKGFLQSQQIENGALPRLEAGLNTFHDFIKRVAINNQGNTDAFPYKNAIQLASTAMERANYMAMDPEIRGWEDIFFDPNIDVSKVYLGVPIHHPVYKCPIMHSGKLRIIIDAYYEILCKGWKYSSDQPRDILYFSQFANRM